MCGAVQEYQKKTLTPKWNEDKWLLVQEPKTQAMRMQCFDHDVLNLKVRATQGFPRERASDKPGLSRLSTMLCCSWPCLSPCDCLRVTAP